MGMILPLIIFVLFLGLNSIVAYRSKALTPPAQQSAAIVNGQNFIRYRDALTNFAAANPGFTGVVPISNLLPYLSGGTPAAFSDMNNIISVAPGGGRQVVSYQTSGGGAATALSQTHFDASVGRVSGGQWTSYSSITNSTSVPVPDSGMASLININ